MISRNEAISIIKKSVIDSDHIMVKRFNEILSFTIANNFTINYAVDKFNRKYGNRAFLVLLDLKIAKIYLDSDNFVSPNCKHGILYALNRNYEFNALNEKDKLFIYKICKL